MSMTLTDFSDGNVVTSALLDANLNALKVNSVYTSTGFNSSAAGLSATNTASYEFADITAAQLGNADFLIISINATVSKTRSSGQDSSASITIKL